MPVFYGWIVVAVAFVTMGIGVSARTAFSLLFAPILDEFGWERGLTAGAFSLGFFVSALGALGFVLCYAFPLAMRRRPTAALLYLMVASQGVLGYGLASIHGAIPAEIFPGRHYATIFATLSVASTAGAGLGPRVAGALYDRTGSYVLAMWLASPGRVRTVAGRTPRFPPR